MDEVKTKLLAKALEWLQTTEEFVIEQAPQIAQEILYWGLAQNVFYAVLYGGAFIFFLLWFFKGNQIQKISDLFKEDTDQSITAGFIRLVFSAIMGFLSVVALPWAAIDRTLASIKILVAPRLYLIEYISDLLKNSGTTQ
jgi:hypothetical protein